MEHFTYEQEKRERKRTIRKVIIAVFSILLLSACAFGYFVYWAFFDMNRLPTGDFITQSTSPDGKYTVKAYLTNGGATTAFAVRAELVINEGSKKKKNIYWQYRDRIADIFWFDNDTVFINGKVLTMPNEKYDYRNE